MDDEGLGAGVEGVHNPYIVGWGFATSPSDDMSGEVKASRRLEMN